MSKKPLIIAHVMLARGYGGIETAYLRYGEVLSYLGYEQIYVTHPHAMVKDRLPALSRALTLAQVGQWDMVAVLHARRILRKHQVDLVICHGNRASRIFWLATRGICKQIVVLHRPKTRGLRLFERIITVTEQLRALAISAGCRPERVIHIPNFLNDISKSEESEAVVSNHTPPVIGFLGRFVREKGLDILLEAFALLRDRGVVFEAVIGGDGEQRSAIERQILALDLQTHVRLVGWVKDPQAFYRRLDVLAVPSRKESFGLIILEAWRAGVPVIATRTAGPQEIITDGKSGLLVDITPHALAEGLEKILSDSNLLQMLRYNGKEALIPYTLTHIAPLLIATIEETQI